MSCMDHCLGHGTCADTMMCTCDQGHGGDSCSPLNPNHVYLKENFKPVNVNVPLRGLIGQHNLQGKFYALISDSFEFMFKKYGIMSGNLPFVFDHQIIYNIKNIDQSNVSS